MIVELFNRKAIIAKHVRAQRLAAASRAGSGVKFNTNLDPGFEMLDEQLDVRIGGNLVAHMDSTVEACDPILETAVAAGEYFQMTALELRSEAY